MPLIANSSLQTGQDGQAEVEFADGSVARLTPNSSFALGQLGQDSVEMQQNSGLIYYELNVGQGHPTFHVEFPGAEVAPTANAIFRMGLDNVPEVAVMTGSVAVSGNGFAATTVSENQSMQLQAGNSAPYTIAQSITPDSWDQWNQDRDQAISQEASQQTSVRDQVGDAGDENWNDLDSYGNWYPVQGSNVWVPAGVSAGWDPFGYGAWGYYPGFGYTYISGYPWGWLPYHCGAWNYYSFGWGWAPGGCGRAWFPVVGVRGYRGYFLPPRPVARVGFGFGFVTVNRGPAARGPWGAGHPLPFINHAATLNVGGRVIAPVGRTSFSAQAGLGARGTSPGVRAALRNPGQSFRYGGAPAGQVGRPGPAFNGQAYQQNRTAPQPQYRAPVQPQYRAPTQPRADSRSTYVPRSTPTPHYSAPPAPPRGAGIEGRRIGTALSPSPRSKTMTRPLHQWDATALLSSSSWKIEAMLSSDTASARISGFIWHAVKHA